MKSVNIFSQPGGKNLVYPANSSVHRTQSENPNAFGQLSLFSPLANSQRSNRSLPSEKVQNKPSSVVSHPASTAKPAIGASQTQMTGKQPQALPAIHPGNSMLLARLRGGNSAFPEQKVASDLLESAASKLAAFHDPENPELEKEAFILPAMRAVGGIGKAIRGFKPASTAGKALFGTGKSLAGGVGGGLKGYVAGEGLDTATRFATGDDPGTRNYAGVGGALYGMLPRKFRKAVRLAGGNNSLVGLGHRARGAGLRMASKPGAGIPAMAMGSAMANPARTLYTAAALRQGGKLQSTLNGGWDHTDPINSANRKAIEAETRFANSMNYASVDDLAAGMQDNMKMLNTYLPDYARNRDRLAWLFGSPDGRRGLLSPKEDASGPGTTETPVPKVEPTYAFAE